MDSPLIAERIGDADVVVMNKTPITRETIETVSYTHLYVLIPEIAIKSGNFIKLPDHVSFTAGALIEPLACCIRGLKNAGTGFNDTVLIVGAGPIGLMHMQLSRIAGAKQVIVSEPNEMRRQVALELGADRVVDPTSENLEQIIKEATGGMGADVIVMAIGVPALVNSTLKLCKKGGTVNLFAGFALSLIHICSGAVDSRVRALSAAQAEFHDSVPFGSIYHP